MENFDRTAECLEMAAVKAGNHSHAPDDIDWFVCQIVCHCQWQFVNDFPRILNCLQGVVASEHGLPVEPYSLSSVKILPSTSSVDIDGAKPL